MSRAYEFAIKLRDLFTPQMMRLADQYERRTSWMSRVWDRFTGMLRSSSQTVDALRRKLGGLNGKVHVDSTELDRARDKAGRLRDELGRFVAGGGGGFKGALLGGLLGGGLSGVMMGAVDVVRDQMQMIQERTVGAAQANESIMFNMVELMGKDVATNIVAAIDRYAPEKRDQLIASSQKLAGAGVAPGQMMEVLKTLNNISALTNTSVEELAYIQSKIKATGYLQGDEMDMFRERGINLNPYIAQVMGIAENQIKKAQEKGLITYDVFEKAMRAYAGTGGKFEGVYERKRDSTVGGAEESLGGKLRARLLAIGDLFLPLKGRILELLSQTLDGTGPLVTMFEKVWNAIRPVWDGVVGLLTSFGILNEKGSISQGLFTTLNGIFEYLGYVMNLVLIGVNGVAHIIGFLIDNSLTRLILMIWGAVKAWGALNFVMNLNPIVRVITIVLALLAAIQYAWETFDGFREGVLRSWEMIKSVFSNVGEFLYKLFTLDFGGALAVLGRAISGGRAAGDRAVAADRKQRKDSRADQILASATTPQVPPGATTPTGPGGNPLAGAAGLNSTVGNAKSNNITINIASLIGRSEITVMDLQEGIDDIESKLIDALLRVANSGSRAVLS